MLKQIASSLFSAIPSGTLRTDTYAAIEATKNWLNSDRVGDGMSVNAILKLVAQHTTLPSSTGSRVTAPTPAQEKSAVTTTSTVAPKTPEAPSAPGTVPFMHITLPSEEIPVAVGGVTNMVLALSRVDGMAGVLAARSWIDALASCNNKHRTDEWRTSVLKGINHMADMSLLTNEFGPRLQIISTLKSVATTLFGRGSEPARQSEAFWSTKLV